MGARVNTNNLTFVVGPGKQAATKCKIHVQVEEGVEVEEAEKSSHDVMTPRPLSLHFKYVVGKQ